MKKKDLRKQPRWLQHLIATLGGYFWLPCPICDEYFGGHEWSTKGEDLMTGDCSYQGVCDNCKEEAKRINRKNFPMYFKYST